MGNKRNKKKEVSKALHPSRWWVDELPETARFYGGTGTLHQAGLLDVEVHQGRVVAVWFRCSTLPFRQVEVDATRAKNMGLIFNPNAGGLTSTAYGRGDGPIRGIVFE